ncbi:MAG: membrane protein insertase YidC [Acidobacteriaceae bacterium]|nr:membrane protein insertase YidC [Acidobacteriaceae bacterium]
MERRLVLVFVLTFVVIVLFQPILKKYLPQTAPTPATESQKEATAPAPMPPAPQVAEENANTAEKGITKQASAESQIVVENDLYRITFTNRGAQVASWILKRFDDDHGKPLDLVNNAASQKYGLPLSLWTYDENQRNKINSVLYMSPESGALTAPATLTFEYAAQNLTVRKVFRFDHSYIVQVETSVFMNGSQITAFPMWPAGLGDENSPVAYAPGRIEYQFNSSVERLPAKKISGGGTQQGPFDWIGVTDQYFAAVFIPDNPQDASAVTLRNYLDIPKDAKNPQDTTKVDVLGVAAGSTHGTTVERIYAGPKELQSLEAVRVPAITGKSPDLRALINFGFFEVIARPLFIWLRWTYRFIQNWGWAIVIQTIIINIALLPLRVSSMKSALKMQRIQPQMNAIKEKYKKYGMRDPRRQDMNTEIGELMKREGVSPVGGCLPMLIQMPFLFAYYSMLGSALDLRHAHWLWIHDLSSPDPFLILPIGIIITGLLTQRMTPQAGMDPSQQKMMNFMMPVMFGIISYRLAAGLCLYWVVGSLIAIVQQSVMNRTGLGQEMREMALKRARKRDKK